MTHVSELAAAIIGGFIGGALGVLSAVVGSYWGPRKLEERREARVEELENGPRKELLAKMLRDTRFKARSLVQLSRVSGTTDEQCRRLLIEIGARGVTMRNGDEGWALIELIPLHRGEVVVDE
jgi:hypothetical protein